MADHVARRRGQFETGQRGPLFTPSVFVVQCDDRHDDVVTGTTISAPSPMLYRFVGVPEASMAEHVEDGLWNVSK